MPATATLAPPRPPPLRRSQRCMSASGTTFARTVAWLDAANGRGPYEIAIRVMKIAEETGEAVAAYIGTTGTNPRKGRHRHR